MLALCMIGMSNSAHSRARVVPPTTVQTAGGEMQVYWNTTLLENVGLHITEILQSQGKTAVGFDRFELTQDSQLTALTHGHSLQGLSGGAMYVRGGYSLQAAETIIALHDFTLRLRAEDTRVFDVTSQTGQTPFFADHIMAEPTADGHNVAVRTMDLRISAGLAQTLGKPEIVGWQIAILHVLSPIHGAPIQPTTVACPDSTRWPGVAVPAHSGETYQADVFLPSLNLQLTACRNCTGPNGAGSIKLTPVTALRNNVNDDSLVPTTPSDPLGTSAARYSADVPWRTKFSPPCPPYGNDQHPFLAWNVYRINAAGQLEQLARSGVKHSHIATNGECLENPGSNHVLGRGCSDAYGTGDNDAPGELGPRSEIIPATGVWGRCGSIYDPMCKGTMEDFRGYDESAYRSIVTEAMISAEKNPGARYFFEGWYVVRDDINPYNSMASLPFVMAWSEKNKMWSANPTSLSTIGPVIDRWVDPFHPAAGTLSREIVTPNGRIKVAVRTTSLGQDRYRYDYVVMNVDFAVATVKGKGANMRILSSHGLTSVELPLPIGVKAENAMFADIDHRLADQWNAVMRPDRIQWLGSGKNELSWGSLFRFSVEANGIPGPTKLSLRAGADVATKALSIDSLGPVTIH